METNIKTAISKIINTQRDTVNKLKFNENAILSISSQINSLNVSETDPIYAAQSGQFALKTELFSGSYIDLTNKPDIPTKVSDLTNDLGFITGYVESDPIYAAQSGQFQLKSDAFSGNYNDLTNKPDIPTKLSDLTNDLESITEESDPIFKSVSGQFVTKDEINEFVNNDSVVLNLILDDINGEENELLSSMNNILNEIIN